MTTCCNFKVNLLSHTKRFRCNGRFCPERAMEWAGVHYGDFNAWLLRFLFILLQSPPSSAEFKERVELYLYSPSGPWWPYLYLTYYDRLVPVSYDSPFFRKSTKRRSRSASCACKLREYYFSSKLREPQKSRAENKWIYTLFETGLRLLTLSVTL
jgi:hypothetical protein